MDLSYLSSVIISTQSDDNDIRICAENEIGIIYSEKMFQLFDSILSIIDTTQDSKLCKICVMFIYHFSRHDPQFNSPDFISLFWPHFSSTIPCIFSSKIIPDTQKALISGVISSFAITLCSIQDCATIQTYLLDLSSRDSLFIPFVAKAIAEIILSSPDLGGFAAADILSILSAPIDPINKCALLCAFAAKTSDPTPLYDSFLSVAHSISQEHLGSVLSLLSTFIETVPLFFAPILDDFTKEICQIVIATTSDTRNKALSLIASLAESAPDMCKASPSFFQPSIAVLIRIMAEINDNAKWSFDPNDFESYTVAKDVFSTLMEKILTNSVASFVLSVKDEIFNHPEAPWPFFHAAISAISKLSLYVYPGILTDENSTASDDQNAIKAYVMPILSELENESLHPRLRAAIYDLVISICKGSIGGLFKRCAFPDFFSALLQLTHIETEPHVRERAHKALLAFVTKLTIDSAAYSDIFMELVENVNRSTAEDLPITVKCLARFVESIPENVFTGFSTLTSIFIKLLSVSESPRFRSIIIESYTICCSKITVVDFDVTSKFLEECLRIRKTAELEQKYMDSCNRALIILISALGRKYEPYSTEILREEFETISKPIEVQFVDFFEEVSLSAERIASRLQGKKCFVQYSDIRAAEDSLSIIAQSCISLGSTFSPYLPKSIEVCKMFICSADFIEGICERSWKLLDACCEISSDIGEEIAEMFLHSIREESSTNYTRLILIVMERTLKKCRVSALTFSNVLASIPSLIETILSLKIGSISKQQQWNLLDINGPRVSNHDENLQHLASLFKRCLKVDQIVTAQFFQHSLQENLIGMLDKSESNVFAVMMLMNYFVTSGDFTLLMRIEPKLFAIAKEDGSDIREALFTGFERLFKKHKINEAKKYFDLLSEVLDDEGILDGSNLLAEDHAIIALTILIRENMEMLDEEEALCEWIKALPIHDVYKRSDEVYDYLLDKLEQRNEYVLNKENMRLILEQCASVKMKSQASERISRRFLDFFKLAVKDERLGEWIEATLAGMESDEQEEASSVGEILGEARSANENEAEESELK